MAYRACVKCMNEYMWQIEDLSELDKEKAKSHAMECISYGVAPTADKIRTLRHFIRLGWMNKVYILEHMFHEVTLKQLKWFLKKGCIATETFETWAVHNNKIDELRVVSKFQELRGPAAYFLGLLDQTTFSRDIIMMVASYTT